MCMLAGSMIKTNVSNNSCKSCKSSTMTFVLLSKARRDERGRGGELEEEKKYEQNTKNVLILCIIAPFLLL